MTKFAVSRGELISFLFMSGLDAKLALGSRISLTIGRTTRQIQDSAEKEIAEAGA